MNTKNINDKIAMYPILNSVKDELFLRNLAPNTIVNYMDGIARFLDFIHYDNSFDITEDHFRQFLFHLRNSSDISVRTMNCYNSFIRFFFQAVLDQPINLSRVPMAKFTPKQIDFLFDHSIRDLLATSAHDSRMDCVIKLALCCGMRINEIVSLKVSDIHTKDRNNMLIFVRESKRNKSRFVPIDRMTYRAIQTYAKEYRICPEEHADLYFISFRSLGQMTSNQTIRRHFNRLCHKADLPDSLTFHSLRHTYAVNFLRAGGELYDLKYRLGHGSIATTAIYLHHSRNMMNTHISYFDQFLKEDLSHAD